MELTPGTKRLLASLKQIFSYGMAAVYVLAGVFLLAKGWYTLTKFQNQAIGILLLAYGLFRIYRIFKVAKSAERIESETNE